MVKCPSHRTANGSRGAFWTPNSTSMFEAPIILVFTHKGGGCLVNPVSLIGSQTTTQPDEVMSSKGTLEWQTSALV